MKNKLTKLLIAIFAIFSFAIVGLNLKPQAEANAYVVNAATYNITNTGDTFYVTKGVDPGDVDVATNVANLAGCFDAILADPTLDANATVEINFNATISTEEQITLTRNFTFSGMLNTDNTSSLFICENPNADKDQEIVCDNLVISTTSDTVEDFAFFEVNNPRTYFTLFNTDFTFFQTYDENTHAIKFNSNNNKLLLKGLVTHDTTYLYNYTPSTLLYLDQDNENQDDFYADNDGAPITTSERIKIAIPYTANSSTISTSIEGSNVQFINLVADQPFFTASKTPVNGSLYVDVMSNFVFNTNNGEFASQDIPTNIFYNNDTPYTFPDQTKIAREHYHFIGWFGQLTYQGTTYYFDQDLIEAYITNGSDPATIPTIFKTDLTTFAAAKGFTSYAYNSNGTAEQYAKYHPVIVMAENGQAPTFIAKWEIDSYTVSFNTNSDTVINSETYDYGSTITAPTTIPTKTGYTFNKWFKDAALTIPFDFATETMPANNITLYAGYTVNSYTITVETNTTETTIAPITYEFGATIEEFSPLTKEGHDFKGWFLNEELTIPFEYETMPAENFTVYAKWDLKKIKVYFNTKGGTTINEIFVDYGTYVEMPTAPTKSGFVFNGWYYDYNCSNDKKVTWEAGNKIQIKEQTTFYANWYPLSYNLVFYDDNHMIETKSYGYGATIEFPSSPEKANFIFGGWYADAALTTPFTLTTMPEQNTYVYVKWISKIIITIDETPQKYIADAINPTFIVDVELKNFVVKYKVDGEWVNDAPTNVGSYDVMVSRNEDADYARFEKVIFGGYVVEPIVADYTWLIAILFAVFALEIIVAIAVRILRKLKKNMVITSLAIITGNTLIPSNQVVLIIISAVCAVAGFVVMCYQLVKLHRTVPLALVTPEDEDTSAEKHFKHSEKVIAEETHTYSAQDIEDMLKHDTVGHAIKEKHNLDELEQIEHKEKIPIGPVVYSEEHDNMQKVEDDEIISQNEEPSKVEIVEDEFIANDTDDNERLYNSDDPFLRKDPNDYSSDNNEN